MTDELRDAGGDALRTIAVFLPKLVAFLLILIIGIFVANAIGKAIDKILERVGFDRAVERGGIKKALAQSKYDASDIVGKLVYYTLLLFVLQMAFGVFGPNPISDLLASVIAFLPRAIVAIVIIVVAAAIATAVRELLSNTLGGLSYGRTLANIAAFYAKYYNFQANNPDVVAGVVVTRFTNAGEVSTRGLEFDMNWVPAPDVTIAGGIAYTKAQVDEFKAAPGAAAGTIIPPGTPLGYAPKWKGALSGDYRWRPGGAAVRGC
jgi:hypothetical protein